MSKTFSADFEDRQNESGLTFNKLGIHYFTPPMLALDIRPIGKMAGDKIPSFAMNFNKAT